MNTETIVAVVLVGLVLFFSLDFDKKYAPKLHDYALHPFARFLSGLVVVGASTMNPIIASLALIAVFFWIADVNLMKSYSL